MSVDPEIVARMITEDPDIILEAACPQCGSKDFYQGLTKVDCPDCGYKGGATKPSKMTPEQAKAFLGGWLGAGASVRKIWLSAKVLPPPLQDPRIIEACEVLDPSLIGQTPTRGQPNPATPTQAAPAPVQPRQPPPAAYKISGRPRNQHSAPAIVTFHRGTVVKADHVVEGRNRPGIGSNTVYIGIGAGNFPRTYGSAWVGHIRPPINDLPEFFKSVKYRRQVAQGNTGISHSYDTVLGFQKFLTASPDNIASIQYQ